MNKDEFPLLSASPKICVLRLSAIGDVMHALLTVRAIQRQWPGCELTWICGKFEYKLLRLVKGVRFLVFDKKSGIKEYLKLWRTIRHERYDVLLHMQVAARANIASMGIRANIRLGWDKARSRDFHQLFINRRIRAVAQQHQVEGFLSFAAALGANVEGVSYGLPVTDAAKEFASTHLDSEKQILIISACSSHALRNWLPERYAKVADYAIEKYGMQVVLCGGPADIEVDMANNISERMESKVLNLVGKDTLEQLLGLLSRATVVLSPDSGPAHIANALGVPVIGLYACTWSRRSGPYSSLKYCVDKFDEAGRQFLGKTAQQLKWGTKIEQPGVMELITVADVKEKLDHLILDGAS